MKRAIFIVGPTGVGKTQLALKISKKFPSALISADSIQAYKDLDIISGKDLPELNSQEIYLLDVISPFESFSVYRFLKEVKPAVEKIYRDKKIPIIVGGTGFYIDSLIKEIETLEVPFNNKLREKLSNFPVAKLQEALRKLNPKKFNSMNISDAGNPRRLIRSIEVEKYKDIKTSTKPIFKENEVLMIGLITDKNKLIEKIRQRVAKRIDQGALVEANKLFEIYEKLSNQVKTAPGYRELFEHLKGNIDLEEAKERWIKREIQTAKKQMTWFKRNKSINWFVIDRRGWEEKVFREIEQIFPF